MYDVATDLLTLILGLSALAIAILSTAKIIEVVRDILQDIGLVDESIVQSIYIKYHCKKLSAINEPGVKYIYTYHKLSEAIEIKEVRIRNSRVLAWAEIFTLYFTLRERRL